ncbi:hypothetical protein F5888DRAFT_857262 [Russula emetica]|nr:hypothetical protein F5888DRAFT_857262 [Russula emetica]
MATTQVLKATHSVDDRVRGVGDRVAGVDGRVKAIDGKVAKIVDASSILAGTQLRENLRKWLSPPDPSTNHNIACGAHLKGTATWFLQGSTFEKWQSSSSLLWIHGKPGSGKSVLCSTIIQDIEAMQEAGQASMGYFYFYFRDTSKQHRHDLLTSLLFQLSARSIPRCDILSRLHAVHDGGARQPTDQELTKCLKKMFTLPDQRPIYLIIDALDESPDTSGIPSPREEVLQLITELVELRLSDLHICVTSRPQVDIRVVLGGLTSLRVCLHVQSGQRNDIVEYVTSVVYSNSERIMRGWGKEEKDLVIETLSKRADGMFQWAFCQLEILRHCLPWAVRRTLEELPESLDETYARILNEIKTPNRDYACRLLQCLVVAIRPLRMEELAEVLAIDFNDEGGVPKLNPRWRWEDQEQALLSSCSSLITIVNAGESRMVQFSHSSVKEYLTSPRLATRSEGLSRYHILLEPAHTILAQACVSVLLQLDDRVVKDGIYNRSPLAPYAARHWVSHAQFGHVSSRIKGMEYLFDKDRPHFGSWLRLFDIDMKPDASSIFPMFIFFGKLKVVPLYYAALCGFHDLAKDIIDEHPQHVNARGGYYMTPLVAALAGRHFKTAQLLYNHGADPNVRCYDRRTPLHAAVQSGHLEMVRKLMEYNADVNAQNRIGWTPLHIASCLVQPNIDVVQLLLERGVDVNARAKDDSTALHEASAYGTPEVVRLLLEHGANVEMKNNNGRTPHQTMSGTPRDKASKLKLLKEFSAQGSTAQGMATANMYKKVAPRRLAFMPHTIILRGSPEPSPSVSSSSTGLAHPLDGESTPSDGDKRTASTAQGSATFNRSTTRHSQRSGRRRTMYLRHVSTIYHCPDRTTPADSPTMISRVDFPDFLRTMDELKGALTSLPTSKLWRKAISTRFYRTILDGT